ncbi:hypothetical protein VUR80DRAFT_2563 [Thermomyces stellatus]
MFLRASVSWSTFLSALVSQRGSFLAVHIYRTYSTIPEDVPNNPCAAISKGAANHVQTLSYLTQKHQSLLPSSLTRRPTPASSGLSQPHKRPFQPETGKLRSDQRRLTCVHPTNAALGPYTKSFEHAQSPTDTKAEGPIAKEKKKKKEKKARA